jgi:hypothetical protein
MIILNNPSAGADIFEFIFNHRKYTHKVGETYTYTDEVGEFLMVTFPFLVRINEEVAEAKGNFKCPLCEFENSEVLVVVNHMKSGHPDAPKGLKLERIKKPGTLPQEATGENFLSYAEKKRQQEEALYNLPDIPKDAGKKDKDGVEWYGGGVETDDPGTAE